MKRVLVIRLISLEIVPLIGALAIGYFVQHYFLWAIAAAAVLILASVALSIRDGAVLEHYGRVCERRKEAGWFWAWIVLHACPGIFFLGTAVRIIGYGSV